MKRKIFGALSAGLLAFSLTACGGGDDVQAFCEADPDIDASDPDAVLEAMRDLADDAPSEIRGDVDTLIEQMEVLQEGNIEDVDQDALQTAAENLSAWERENCDN